MNENNINGFELKVDPVVQPAPSSTLDTNNIIIGQKNLMQGNKGKLFSKKGTA